MLQHDLGDIKFSKTHDLLTLGDLLSRLNQTMHSFQGVTGKDPKWFPTTVTTYAAETHFLLYTKPPDEVLKLVDQTSVTIQPMPKGWPNMTLPIPQKGLVFRHEPGATHQSKFPLFHDNEKSPGLMQGIADFPNGDKLNEFFKLYLTSFILGTLARYFPTRRCTHSGSNRQGPKVVPDDRHHLRSRNPFSPVYKAARRGSETS